MQKEYEAFFAQKYIDDIARCGDTEFELLIDEDKTSN